MEKENLEKVKKCKTVEEVLELAKKSDKKITKEQAKRAFDMTHGNVELSDAEISSVSGGTICLNARYPYEDVDYDTLGAVQFIFKKGDNVPFYYNETNNSISACKIDKCFAVKDIATNKWYDAYDVEYTIDGSLQHAYNCRRSKFKK